MRTGTTSWLVVVVALGACGGGGSAGGGGPASIVVGAAGGTVSGPGGATVVIPPGALTADTTIGIEQTSAGAPALPGDVSPSGQMFALTPHGTSFAVPVTVIMPFDRKLVPAGTTPVLYKTDSQNQWGAVADASFGADAVTANVSSFSWFWAGELGVQREAPLRSWTFSSSTAKGLTVVGNGTQTGGD